MPDIIGYALEIFWGNSAVVMIATERAGPPWHPSASTSNAAMLFVSNSVLQVVVISQAQARDVPFRQSRLPFALHCQVWSFGCRLDGDVLYAKGAVSSISSLLSSTMSPHHPFMTQHIESVGGLVDNRSFSVCKNG